MEPLRITATPVGGIACDGYLPLDSILAWAARMRRVGMHRMALRVDDAIEDEWLPLEARGDGDDWYWAASCVRCRWLARDVRHWNKRVDIGPAVEWVAGDWKPIYTGGLYKAYHQPLYLLVAAKLTWYAYGDGEQLADLLREIRSLGKKTAHGVGQLVDGFTVEPWHADWSEIDEAGALTRPVPVSGPSGAEHVAQYGIRSPYWHPATRRTCAMPALHLPSAVPVVSGVTGG